MSADPFATLEACVAAYSKIIEDLGGCDHSVGICMCSEIAHTRKAAQAIGQLRDRVAELEKERDGVKELMRHRLQGHDLMTIQRNEARDERDGLKRRVAELESTLRQIATDAMDVSPYIETVALNVLARAESSNKAKPSQELYDKLGDDMRHE